MEPGALLLLEKGLEQLDLGKSPLRRALEDFLNELERWNTQFGFVHASGKDLIVRHVLDSLAGVSFFRTLDPRSVGDLGSGAGFPGIPLAIVLPHVQFTLIEPSRKRAAFLRNMASLLQLKNLRVWEKDLAYLVRHLGKEEYFPCITFRALSPLMPKELKQILRILRKDGSIVAYKGRWEQTEREARIAEKMGLRTRIVGVSVPFLEEERNLLWISW